MKERSRRPRGLRALVSPPGVAMLGVLILAGCGDAGDRPATAPRASGAATGADAATQRGGGRLVRPGCGRYCRQAGGYGGQATGGAMVDILAKGRLAALDAGTAAIPLACRFRARCTGALLLQFSSAEPGQSDGPYDVGRVDLEIAAGDAATLAVPLSPFARRRLRERGEIRVLATADTFPSLQALPVAERRGWSALSYEMLVISRPAGPPP